MLWIIWSRRRPLARPAHHPRSRQPLSQLFRHPRAALAAGLALALVAGSPLAGDLRLADPGAEVYYTLAVVAGERIQLAGDAVIEGDVHSNGEIQLANGSRIEGNASAVDRVKPQGEVTGEVVEGAEEIALPEIPDEAGLRKLADRVIEGDVTFDRDLVVDDVLLVAGNVRVPAALNGTGTLIALGEIRLDGAESTRGGSGLEEVPLDDSTRLSLIATGDVRLGKGRALRGVIQAGRDVAVEKEVTFDGVIVADRRVDVDKDSRIRFASPDDTAPSIELVSPPDGAVLSTSQPPIEVRLEDDLSGVKASTLLVLLDGVEVTQEVVLTDSGFTLHPAPLPEGAHRLDVSVADVAGNEASASFSFLTDTVVPELSITSPSEAVLLNQVPPVSVAFSDATSGIDPASLQIALDGTDLTATCAVEADLAVCPTPDLAEGAHEVSAKVADLAGNLAQASFAFELIIDTDPPFLQVLSPQDGEVVRDPSLTVVGTAVDASGVAAVLVNGAPAALAGDQFTALVLLEPGPNTIVVLGTDIVGNSTSLSLTVTLGGDVTPPQLHITAPAPGLFVTDARPLVDLSFQDDDSGVDVASLALSANGAPLLADCNAGLLGARCTPLADLPDGPVTLGAFLADLDGNGATAEVSFAVDSEGLEVILATPAPGLVTRDGQVTVSGQVVPGAASVSVNGIPASLSGSTFSAVVPLREGTNMIVALATKSNGRTGTGSLEVTRDLVAPTVRITSPSDGFRAIEGRIAVTGLVNDLVSGPVVPSVQVNGKPVPVQGGAFLLEDLELVPGPNVVEAVATDAVGNEGRHRITIDFQPPVGLRLVVNGGQGQSGLVRQALSQPLTARVVDDLGNPVAGRVVRFEVSHNSGTLRLGALDTPARAVQVPSDGFGRASALLTLGDTAGEGNNRVRATAVGVAGELEFCATGLPAPAEKILMVEGDNQRGTVGHPLASPLVALMVDRNGNPLAGVPVTFRVVQGGGTLDGAVQQVRNTGADGLARAVLTLSPLPGINNNLVTATFPGHTGLPASFSASGLAPGDPARTALAGVVLDNGHTPIPGARVSIAGTTLETVTDEDGQFELSGVPVGHLEVDIDPADSPRQETFPPLAFETVTVAGQRNGLGQPILLPFLKSESAQLVGGSEDVTLTMPGVEGLSLTVFAGSATFPDGSKTGLLSISQVHLDKVPMPPPSGTIFMPPAWTVQPAGVLFDPPARITIPNDGLAPGRVIDIFQFDHSLNQFVNVGKGSASDDGFVIVSEPGFGITRSGWGGCGQPQPPPTCGSGCDDSNSCTDDRCEDGSCVHEPKAEGSSCDDMDMCTDNDVCTGGSCKGKAKPPKQLDSFQVGVDLAKVLGPVNRLNERLGGPCKLALAFSVSASRTEECCSQKEQTVTNVSGNGGGTAGVACEFPTPWSIPLGPVKAGIFINASLTANAQLSVTNNKCTDKLMWSGGGSAALNVGVTGKIKAGKAVDVKVSGMSGGGCPLRVVNNQIECRLSHSGLVVTAEAELLNGVITVAFNKVLIQPGGDYPVTAPLPFVN